MSARLLCRALVAAFLNASSGLGSSDQAVPPALPNVTFDFSRAVATNAADYLHSIVPYASTGVTHPDVYYNPSGWNGWKYWMVATPYSGRDAQYENPSLWVSEDGLTWQVPPGVTNPVVPPPPNPGAANYNSDPDLVDGLDGSLYLFYRQLWQTSEGGPGEVMYYITSQDGVTWSAPVSTGLISNITYDRIASPAFLYDGKTWTVYYVNIGSSAVGSYRVRKRTASSPFGPWSSYVDVTPAVPRGKAWWHINANKFGDLTVLLLDAATPGSYGVGSGSLYLAWSKDGTRFAINNRTPLLRPSAAGWDKKSLYRAAMVPVIDGSNKKLAIWYGGIGTAGWQIGYTEANVTGP